MGYQSLYRKWRPQRFEEVIGQRHVTQTLRNAIRSGNIAHAYLFSGPRGSGKTTTARLLAKALNCEKGPTPEPCNECDMCRAIAEGRAIDIIEMDAASSTSVDDVRELRETVRLAPAQARYKFYIIDEVHRLSRAAFDALLKTLEEPPPNVIFVLATTEPNRVPATIASRCQRFDFRRGSEREIKQYLRRVCEGEGIEIDEAALSLLASQAEGSWRDALSLLEQVWAYSNEKINAQTVGEVLGIVEEETLSRFIRAIAQGEVKEGISIIGEILDAGKDPREFLRGLSNRFRDILLVKLGGTALLEIGEETKKELLEEAGYFSPETLLRMLETVFSQENVLRLSPSPRLPLEMLLVHLLQVIGKLRETEIKGAKEGKEEKTIVSKGEVEEKAAVGKERIEEKEKVEEKPPAVGEEQLGKEEERPVTAKIELGDVLEKWQEVMRKLQAREGTSNLWAIFKQGVKPIAADENYLTIGFPQSLDFARKIFDKDEGKHKVLLAILQSIFPGVSWKLKTALIENAETQGIENAETQEIEKAEPQRPGNADMQDIENGKIENEADLRETSEENEEIERFRSIFPEAEPLD